MKRGGKDERPCFFSQAPKRANFIAMQTIRGGREREREREGQRERERERERENE